MAGTLSLRKRRVNRSMPGKVTCQLKGGVCLVDMNAKSNSNSNSPKRLFGITQPTSLKNSRRQASIALECSPDKQDYVQRWLCDVFVALNYKVPDLPPHGRDPDDGKSCETQQAKAEYGQNNNVITSRTERPCSSARPQAFDIPPKYTGSCSGASSGGEEEGQRPGRHNMRCYSSASSSRFVAEEKVWQAKRKRRKTREDRYSRRKQERQSKRNCPKSRQKEQSQRLHNSALRKDVAERFQSNYIGSTMVTLPPNQNRGFLAYAKVSDTNLVSNLVINGIKLGQEKTQTPSLDNVPPKLEIQTNQDEKNDRGENRKFIDEDRRNTSPDFDVCDDDWLYDADADLADLDQPSEYIQSLDQEVYEDLLRSRTTNRPSYDGLCNNFSPRNIVACSNPTDGLNQTLQFWRRNHFR